MHGGTLMTYDRRPAAEGGDAGGRVGGLSALLFLRALGACDKFLLAAGLRGAGLFGDVVLLQREGGRTSGCFVHRAADPPSPAPSADPAASYVFSRLLRLFASFRDVLVALPWLEDLFAEEVADVEAVYYTEAKLGAVSSYPLADHVADAGGLVSSLSASRRAWEAHEEAKKLLEFLQDFAFDVRDGGDDGVLQESIDVFRSVVASEEVLERLEVLGGDPSLDTVQRLISDVSSAADKTKFRTFLDKFKVFHSQANSDQEMDLVKDEFLKLLGIEPDDDPLNDYLDDIFAEFVKNVQKWVDKGDYWLSEDSVLWTNVIGEVTRAVSNPLIQMIMPYNVQFSEENLESLSELVLENKVVCVQTQSDTPVLNLMKIHQILEGIDYFLLDVNTMLKNRNLVLKALDNLWCSLLVLDTSGAHTSELSLLLNDISKVLEKNEDGRLILVTKNGGELLFPCLQMLNIEYCLHEDIISWSSLNADSQAALLNKRVLSQGIATNLGTIIAPFPDVLKELRHEFLCTLLVTHELSIGSHLPTFKEYIPRALSRTTTVNMTILRSKIPNTLIALGGASAPELIEVIPKGENFHVFSSSEDTIEVFEGINIAVLEDAGSEEVFRCQAEDGDANVHCFHLINEKLIWKWSVRDMSTLEQYLLKDKAQSYQLESALAVPEDVVIVSGAAGEGKTVYLHQLARDTKAVDPSLWVVHLNISHHADVINDTLFDDESKIYPLVRNLALYPNENSLCDLLFAHHWVDGRVAVFLDGLEMVPPHVQSQAVDLIKLLRSHVRYTFVGCRPDAQNLLVDSLSVLAFSLRPLGEGEQRAYLRERWGGSGADDARLGAFVDAVVATLSRSLGAEDRKLCCAPLLTTLAAFAFEEELRAYVTSGILGVPSTLDLVTLYDMYVERKSFEYLLRRTDGTDTLTQHLLLENRVRLRDRYVVLAMSLLLAEDDAKVFNLISAQYKSVKDLSKLRQTVGPGSLIRLWNERPVFVHPTLAEYFLGSWLAEAGVRGAARGFVEARLMGEGLRGARAWWHRALARRRDLHWAVLNGDEARVRALLEAGADANAADDGGRTPLHLAAALDRGAETLALLERGADAGAACSVLGWRPARYADAAFALRPLDALLPRSKAVRADMTYTAAAACDDARQGPLLLAAARHGLLNLLEYLCAAGADLKLPLDVDGSTALHVAAESGQTDAVRFLIAKEQELEREATLCANVFRLLKKPSAANAARADINARRPDGSSPALLAAAAGHTHTLRALAAAGASLNVRRLDGATALHVAVAGNHGEAARAAVEGGADVGRGDGEGATPLHVAAAEGHVGLLRMLLETVTEVDAGDNMGATALHWAAIGGHLRCVEALVQAGAGVNARDEDRCTALHWAALDGQSHVARYLMKQGAEVKLCSRSGASAMHTAARSNKPGTLSALAEAGASVNILNEDGAAPLHWACAKGRLPAVDCLLRLGAHTDVADYNGFTPLHMSARRGDARVLGRLLRAGAAIEPPGGLRAPPLHLAASGRGPGHATCVRALLAAGAGANVRDHSGATALHWSAFAGAEGEGDGQGSLAALLAAGGDVDAADNQGSTALHWAAGAGHAEAAEALVAAGADVRAANRDGETPLHWAAKEGHAEVVNVLLAAGADPTAANGDGVSAERLAMRVPHMHVVEILRRAGAGAGEGAEEAKRAQDTLSSSSSSSEDCEEGRAGRRGSSSSSAEEDDSRPTFYPPSLSNYDDDDRGKVSLVRMSMGAVEFQGAPPSPLPRDRPPHATPSPKSALRRPSTLPLPERRQSRVTFSEDVDAADEQPEQQGGWWGNLGIVRLAKRALGSPTEDDGAASSVEPLATWDGVAEEGPVGIHVRSASGDSSDSDVVEYLACAVSTAVRVDGEEGGSGRASQPAPAPAPAPTPSPAPTNAPAAPFHFRNSSDASGISV